jgi:eukaryotic-like serine/threonine-protein kinase
MNNDHSEAAPKIDQQIGPYCVRRLLGEGAFGAVYEAIKQPLGKRVALKLLHRRWSSDTHITARFLQEARAAASLRHPHIVDVDDVGVFEGSPWIAMEFLEGESLAERLASEGPMRVERALEVLLPIFSAVAAIHDAGIIHRDLKLENVQLWIGTAAGEHPKLLDFGIAKVSSSSQDLSLTGATDVMGTPEYMAPEQWRSAKHVDPASDQWALAVMLYRLLTDVSPFEGDSPQSVMFRVSTEPPPPFEGALADERALEQALHRALQKEPQKRFASVRAFGAALLPFASEGTRQRWRAEFVRTSERPAPSAPRGAETIATRRRSTPPTDTLVATSTEVIAAPPRSRKPTALAAIAAVAIAVAGVASLSRGHARTSIPRFAAAPSAASARPVTAVAPQSLAPQSLAPQALAPRALAPQSLAPQSLAPRALSDAPASASEPVLRAPASSARATGRARSRRSGAAETQGASAPAALATPNI